MNSTSSPASPSLSPREGFIFFSFYLLSLALCVALPRALTFLPACVALCSVLYMGMKYRALPHIDKKFFFYFGGFGVLMALSALWSPDAGYTFEKALKNCAALFGGLLPLIMASGMPSNTTHKNTLISAAALMCALAGAILFFEYRTMFEFSRLFMGIHSDERGDWPVSIRSGFLLNRSAVYVVLLSFPVLLMLRTSDLTKIRKNFLSALLVFCVGLALLITNSQTAQIAAILSVPMLFFPGHRRNARRAMMAALFLTMLLTPLIPIPADAFFLHSRANNAGEGFLMDASVPHRLEVWKFMAEQIAQAPMFGHGIEATRFLHAGYIMPNMGTDQVLHPHNAVLQIWIELGLVGIVFVMGFITFMLQKLETMPPVMQRYYTIFFIVTLGVLSMGYGLWQSWLIGMLFSLIGFSRMAARITGADESTK